MDENSTASGLHERVLSLALWIARTAVAAGFSFVVLTLSHFPYDDAFIHLRIARNLAAHGQPYFNLGARVMADSSPLWMVLVAGLFKILPGSGPSSVAALECGIATTLFLGLNQGACPRASARAMSPMAGEAGQSARGRCRCRAGPRRRRSLGPFAS